MKSEDRNTILLTLLALTGLGGFFYSGLGMFDDCNDGWWIINGERYEGKIINATLDSKYDFGGEGWVYKIQFDDEDLSHYITGNWVYYKDICEQNRDEPLEIGQKVVFNGARLGANEFFTYNRYNVLKMEVLP